MPLSQTPVAIISEIFTNNEDHGRPLKFFLQKDLGAQLLEELREKILENGGIISDAVPLQITHFFVYDATNPRSKGQAAAFSDNPALRDIVHWTFINECIAAQGIVDYEAPMPGEPRPRPVVELDIDREKRILQGFLEQDFKDQLTVYAHPSISDRRRRREICELVEEYAGFYVMRPEDARIVIAEDTDDGNFVTFKQLRDEARLTDQYIETEETLRRWIEVGIVELTGPMNIKGLSGRPPGTRPVEFTPADDRILISYISRQLPCEDYGGRRGNSLYQELSRRLQNGVGFGRFSATEITHAKRHTWQSWRTRYRNQRDWFDAQIEAHVQKYPALVRSGGKFPNRRGYRSVRAPPRRPRPARAGPGDDENVRENEGESDENEDKENEAPHEGPGSSALVRPNPGRQARRAPAPHYRPHSSPGWKVPDRKGKGKGKAKRVNTPEEEDDEDIDMERNQGQGEDFFAPSPQSPHRTPNAVPSSIPPPYATQAPLPTYHTQVPQVNVNRPAGSEPGPSRQPGTSSAEVPEADRAAPEEALSSPFQLRQPAQPMPVLPAVQRSIVSPHASQGSAANVSTGSGDADEVEQFLAETPDDVDGTSGRENEAAPMSDVEETENSEEASPTQAVPSSTRAFLEDATSVPLARRSPSLARRSPSAGPSRVTGTVRNRPRVSDPFPSVNPNPSRRPYRPSFGTFGRTDMDGPRTINFYMSDNEQPAVQTPSLAFAGPSNDLPPRDGASRLSRQDAEAQLRAERQQNLDTLSRLFPEFSLLTIDRRLSESGDVLELAQTQLTQLQRVHIQTEGELMSPTPESADYHPPLRTRAAKQRRVSERIGEL